jgi:hypothetical protein
VSYKKGNKIVLKVLLQKISKSAFPIETHHYSYAVRALSWVKHKSIDVEKKAMQNMTFFFVK